MAEFLKGDAINHELTKILENAKEQITIVSPFIKLHSRVKDVLKDYLEQPKVKITVVFGKNEKEKSKSFSKNEFDFFCEFPNIEIYYEERLHAKYYANESSAILSSMNLYEYSQNNNIEFGILTKTSLIGSITNIGTSLDADAYNYFNQVINKSQLVFKREPTYEKANFGLTSKYVDSKVEVDHLSKELSSKQEKRIVKSNLVQSNFGYCIRTGVKIPLNAKKPFSDKAFDSWNKFKDQNYSEKFCHFSGESSNGETSYSRPILRKNWKKSQGK